MAAGEVVGVVLAAGDGVRMGGSKALLLVDGEPLAVAHARRLREGGCGRVVVVARPGIVAALADWMEGVGSGSARVLPSTAPDPAGSLSVAVREGGVGPEDVVVITPVDAAPVATETIASLRGALRRGVEAATPSRGGKGGHPVVCRGSVLEPFRRDERPPPLRDVLGALGEKRARVETQDGLVLVDLDTPEDVVAWTGRAPAFGGRKQR